MAKPGDQVTTGYGSGSAQSVDHLNNAFIRAEQFVHQAISNKSKETMSIWRDMIGLGNFEYGRGFIMKKHSFYGGKETTNSAGDWYNLTDLQKRDNKSSGGDNDALLHDISSGDAASPAEDVGNLGQYNPVVTDYGFEEKQYTIYETTRRTRDICLRDIVFQWQFEQQLEMIFNSLADITLGAWEKWLRETYVTFATKQLVAEGFPSFTITNGASGTVVNQAGLREIDLGGTPMDSIGVLSQDVLDYHYQYLARQARPGKVADGENGMPVFALVTSFETSTELISKDTVRNQDMRYARPSFLLEGYGTITGYKNFAHSHDLETPRYKPTVGGKLERVYPYEFTPTSIGNATNINKDYVYAPFELSIIFLKDVYRGLVPENPTAVAGATFGGASNLGTYKWINIEDRETNLLGETGFMFARFNCAPEPMDQVDNALVLLHRRHQVVPIVQPAQGTGSDNAAVSDTGMTAEAFSAVVDNGEGSADTDTAYTAVEITLSAAFNTKQIGDVVEATYNTSDTQNLLISRDYGNGRYRFIPVTNAAGDAESTAADWATVLATNSDFSITG